MNCLPSLPYKKQTKQAGLHGLFTLLLCASFSATAYAQSTVETELIQGFARYHEQALQEKLFIHTDGTNYLAGETLWFKVYAVEGSQHQPLDLSQVAYLELLDKNNKPVLQAKLAMEEGSGHGSFYLPLSLATGNYKLRGYTNWMKNYSPDFYFEKVISLVNTFTNPDLQTSNQQAGFDLQFFPEGGELVNGIRSKVAFKAVDSNGKGLAIKGAVLGVQGDTLALIDPLKFGMGHFYLTPAANAAYRAVVKTPHNQSRTFSLPAARAQGYVMHVEDTDQDLINVHVRATAENETVYLFVHTRQEAKLMGAAKISGQKAVFKLSKKGMGEGISHITLFNPQKQPIAERLYFNYPQNTLNIQVQADKQQYAARQKAVVQLSTLGENREALPANVSMAVYRVDSLTENEGNHILSYLWLTSDLKGYIESPAYYFNQEDPEAKEALDNLLLTQGWRRFRWADVVQGQRPTLPYLPEYEGHIVEAIIRDKSSESAAEGVTSFLSVPGTQAKVYASKSNRQGSILFNTKKIYGARNIVVQSIYNQKEDSTYTVSLASPYSREFSGNPVPPLSLPANYQKPLEARHVQMQAQNVYWADEINRFYNPDSASSPFYRAPDKTYLLDDYVRFPTMEEVMREYVYEVSVRKQHGKYVLKVADPVTREFLQRAPLVLFDGVPVFDVDKVMAYDPLKIEKLEVLTDRFIVQGGGVYRGIVSYTTYKGSLKAYPLGPGALDLPFEGLQLQREFYSPSYATAEQQSSRKPDFRNLLHWAPDIRTGKEGEASVKFYTSDLQGKFIIVLQGISPNGAAGISIHTIEVKEGAL